MTTEAATQTEEVPEAKDVSEKEATIVEADIDVEDNKNEEEEEEEKLIQIADNMADMSSEDKSDSAIIPVDPHNIEIPTIRSISIKDFKAFFGSRDFAPSIPFPWAIYQKLRATAPNIVELIRTSCSAISGHSKYVDINYSYLAEYANIVCKKQEAIRVKMIKKMTMNEKKEEEESEEDEMDEICKFQAKLERMKLSERDIINLLCLFVTLQFGSGFHNHNNKKQRNEIISIGIQNMYKIYGSLTTKTLNNIEWTIDSISELFEINYEKSLPLKSLCDMIRKCIEEIIHILSLKDFTDFAAYVYYHIDLAWIKSQTKELSALQDVEWILNQSGKLGLELAPTKSNNVRRCVVVGFNGGIDNPKHLNKLVENRAFIYAINDQVVYNLKFNQIIHKIKEICNESTEPNYYVDNIDDNNNQEKKRFITIQFGLHLDREPNTVQALLFNFINDFPCLNDQYLYKSVFGNNKNLRIYLFQKVQLIVQELYNNLYKKKNIRIFNFKDINSLVPLGHNIPFVLLNENVIKLKDEFKNEFEQYIDDQYILKASDLEVEMRASSLWAIELLSTKYNVHGLTTYLSNRGECNEYKNHRRHYVRDTVYY